jgi:hypothetical protein
MFAHISRKPSAIAPSTCQPAGNTANQTPIRMQLRISIYRDRGADHGSNECRAIQSNKEAFCAAMRAGRSACAFQQGNNASDEPERPQKARRYLLV